MTWEGRGGGGDWGSRSALLPGLIAPLIERAGVYFRGFGPNSIALARLYDYFKRQSPFDSAPRTTGNEAGSLSFRDRISGTFCLQCLY